ncbi:hypothetical protein SeMB42_g01452 [Synchytrium endobioticum]|uniref:Peptidase M20 dimerisation domain-containing protein n=1 Tax=Synchytrium endobioticum TaxID=286115 RepID=A0A507D6R3_9FUNG|nr:hypothetical protein SeLEV6574_g02791 [Synchytrium endobioticum]TPX52406.1 hypothetical protein SeMB42_g01452 [Synchytrium endobioticum]
MSYFFQQVSRSYTEVPIGADSGIDTVFFLEATENLIKLFDFINATAFALVKGDMIGNVAKIRSKFLTNPASLPTLQSIVVAESKEKVKTATEGLLWLERGLLFTAMALRRNIDNPNEELGKSFQEAYKASLGQYHNFLVRQGVNLAMNACPYRKDFYAKLSPDPQELAVKLGDWLAALERINIIISITWTFSGSKKQCPRPESVAASSSLAMASAPTSLEILASVDALFPQATKMLEDLVRFNSTRGGPDEKSLQDFMELKFKELGLTQIDKWQVDLREIQSSKYPSPVTWTYENKINVVATHNPKTKKGRGRSLVLNGHIDVVPEGPHDMWTTPPFNPSIRSGKMYGRGTGDMKAGIVAYYYAFKALQSLGYQPASKVIMQAVTEEECTGNGALACVARGYVGDACIIPEPFNGIQAAQVGVIWLTVRVRGKPAHVMEMAVGSNAIMAAFDLFRELQILEEEWNKTKPPVYAATHHPINVNMGKINGGNWASSVPCECTFEVRVGVYPGTEPRTIQSQIESALAAKAKQMGVECVVSYGGFVAPGVEMNPEWDIIKLLSQVHERVTGRAPPSIASTATTDARVFIVEAGVPTTCYGPKAERIHGIDECVDLQSVKEVTGVLACFIAEWCGLEKQE